MANQSKTWLAAYLYYNEPWEEFLVKSVQPFVQQMITSKLADQYFFIRYWEKGPHIRLRFYGDIDVLNEKVKPALIRHFEAWFEENPSERTDPEWMKEAVAEHRWFPNNTVQFIDYEPETDRYGGEAATLLAERQFNASSNATFDVISESLQSWDYNRALGAAIQLHLGFAFGIGMNQEEAAAFFSNVFQNWAPRAYYFFEKDITSEELERRRLETLKAFETNFQNQKDALLPFFQTVWEAFEDGQLFDQEWLNQWVVDMTAIKEQLDKLQQNNQLVIPDWYQVKEFNTIPEENKQRWAIYDSYIHMVNNRLGIMNRDEGYLAYLVRESFKLLPELNRK